MQKGKKHSPFARLVFVLVYSCSDFFLGNQKNNSTTFQSFHL